MLASGVLVQVALLLGGILWCREMFGRWRSDLDEFRSSTDSNARGAIALLWAATAVILFFLVRSAIEVVRIALA